MYKFIVFILVLFVYSPFVHAQAESKQSFPFVVAIYNNSHHYEDREAICTGTVVSKTLVLTAAHCVYDFDASRIVRPSERLVGLGSSAQNKHSAKKVVPVERIYIFNNKRDDRFTRDVALLKLGLATEITPVGLPSSNDALPLLKSSKQAALAVGFGDKKVMVPPGRYTRVYLNAGNEIIQSDQETVELINKYKRLEHVPFNFDVPTYNPNTMLGATAIEGIPPTARDSGGPLLLKIDQQNNSNKFIQVGIISWGLPPSFIAYKKGYMKKEPGIYTNLTDKETLAFIQKTIKQYS